MKMATPMYSSWCEISCTQIEANLKIALGLLPDKTKFCAVVKADAYGHGIANVMPIIQRNNVRYVGITSNAEAQTVRDTGYKGDLLRLRATTRDEAEAALPLQVQEQVGSLEGALELASVRRTNSAPANYHLSLNAGGMSRDGLELSSPKGKEVCKRIVDLLGPHIIGVSTHFPSNLPEDLETSIARFHKDVDWVVANTSLQRENLLVHAGSTLTLVSPCNPHSDMMRCGAVLYGIVKSELGFKTTMTLKARVISLGEFPAGSTIGYDRATVLNEDKRLATVSLGYANGYLRRFAGLSSVLIQGRKQPVLGKISMNTIVVDVTDLTGVALGEEVVLFGRQQSAEITTQMAEASSGTIMADLYTDWGQRNPRVVKHTQDVPKKETLLI
ncbi:alanine racemase [Pseudovibrio ascidiaceicola]|uniref:alanine racemase n=2 Tax=Pseudovibrio ascidiaceicola TaxID=285279 RepID=A0A1I4E9F3_9HYPH|nr:alanine racemase [Pseudovibrio ascidiaceicola]